MRTKLLVLAGTVTATCAAPLGCGSLDGHVGTPDALATVQGELQDPSDYAPQGEVRVAVVWRNIDTRGVGYTASEDLPVQPVFPSSFVVHFDGPPPEVALGLLQGFSVPIAVGVVVAYEDLNGNGKLDLVSSEAGAFIDRIVGTNENLSIFYIGGPVPPQATQGFVGTPTPGYNVLEALVCQTSPSGGASSGMGSSSGGGSGSTEEDAASALGDADVPLTDASADPDAPFGRCTPPPPQWLPMTTRYDLTVSSDPKFNQIMCKDGADATSSASGVGFGPWDVSMRGAPPGGYPSATDPGLTCDGSSGYFYQHCVTTQTAVCGPSTTNCTDIEVVLGASSPPPGWPCP